MGSLRLWLAWTSLLGCAALLPARPHAEAGCCHSPGGCGTNILPPLVGLREPFDPPPPAPDAPPPSPGAGPSGAPPPAEPQDPQAPQPPTTLPSTPSQPSSPSTLRRGGATAVDTLSATSWQYWWSLNQPGTLPRIRRQAAHADGPYASTLPPELRAAVDLLLETLRDPDDQVAQAAAGAFAGFVSDYRAEDTLTALREGARGHDLWVRDLCHLALGARKDRESLAGMRRVALARHEPDVSRVFAALGLLQLGAPEVWPELYELAQDLSVPAVAGGVLVGLGGTGDRAHLPTLLEAARRRVGSAPRLRRVRADALTALGSLAHPSTVPYLAGLLDDREHVIARSAAIALGGFAENAEAAAALGRVCLTSEDPWVRALAAVSLGRGNAPEALPSLARMVREEQDVCVRGFATLAIGLTGIAGSERILAPALAEEPRAGEFGAAALAVGLLKAQGERLKLEAALTDTRTHLAPGCAAVGLGLLGDPSAQAGLRARFWLDSSRVRPGFDRGLALLDAEGQAGWLVGQLGTARRSGERRVLLDALAFCAGPPESEALVGLFRKGPPGDTGVRVRVVFALAELLRDHELTYARRLLLHTYYLQANEALSHLGMLP